MISGIINTKVGSIYITMKKTLKVIGFSVLASGIIGIFSLVGAQNVPGSGTSTGPAAGQLKFKVAEEKVLKIRNTFVIMENRFTVQLRNLDLVASRIQNWIDRAITEGKDVSDVKIKLEEAKVKIQEAKDALAKIKTDIENIFYSDKPKTAFNAIKDAPKKVIVVKIKEAHRALVEAIIVLKKHYGVSTQATSTPATATTTSGTTTPNN